MVAISEIPKGSKKTDIGIIPNDWNVKIFADISYMKGRIGWQGLKQSEFTMNPDEPFLITGMNFKDGEIRWDEVYHVPEKRYEIAKDIQLKKGDVLITKDGTIGKLLYVRNIPYPNKATLNSHLLVLRPVNRSYVPLYLYYNLSSPFFKNHIELSKSGTTFFGISQESVGKYKIPLPPTKEEQSAIATALNDADELINSLEKLIAKKRMIKQGAMQELLKPKDVWEQKTLGEIADYRNGKSYESRITENGDYFLITLNSINIDGKLKDEHLKIDFNDNSLSKNDLIMILSDVAHGYFLGLTDIVPESNKYVLNQRVGALKNIRDVLPIFLRMYININQKYFKMNGQGSSQQNLGKESILNFEVSYPALSYQKAICQILSGMDSEIEALEKKLEKYKMLKQGMMQNLLIGKIRLV